MEYTRAQTLAQDKQGAALKRVDRLFLRAALPHPKRLRFGAHLLRYTNAPGCGNWPGTSGLLKLLPQSLAEMEAQLPDLGRPFLWPHQAGLPGTATASGNGYRPQTNPHRGPALRLRDALDAGRDYASGGARPDPQRL